jgi:hypothetical protein
MTGEMALRRSTLASLLLLAFGLVWLLGYCLAEAIISGTSLVDAYWLGLLPWMGIAVALVVVGASACIVVGTITALVWGGWLRRLLVIPPLAISGLWWLIAVQPFHGGAYCSACPPAESDPWAYAYSLPVTAVLFLLLPALVVVVLTLVGRDEESPRLAVHPHAQ